jgi:hypothetical protein
MSCQETLLTRQLKSKPIVTEFFEWVDEHRSKVLPKSLIGAALQYAWNQKPYLLTFLEDGRINFSSNAVERSIRPFACHRHAWMFCGSPRGAQASAICYSIIASAKLNNLKPYEYLKYVLFELAQRQSDDPVLDLLPWSSALPESCKPRLTPNA